jgi:sulfur-carrier protein
VDSITIRVRAFARIREVLGEGEFELDVPEGSTLADVWERLRSRTREMDRLASSTRMARNGRVSAFLTETVEPGDEVALLPPVGGG